MILLSIIECLIIFIVSGIGLICHQRLSLPFKILTWSTVIIFILAVISRIFDNKYKNNAPILQIECITKYIFYSLVYYYLFKNKLIKKAIIISIVIISICFIINAIFVQPFSKVFPTNIYISSHILFAVFSLMLFKEMLIYPIKINIIKQSVFWYNTAILFYTTTMFFNLGLSNYLAVHNLNDYFIFYFWYFIIYFFNLLICVAILTENNKNALSNA